MQPQHKTGKVTGSDIFRTKRISGVQKFGRLIKKPNYLTLKIRLKRDHHEVRREISEIDKPVTTKF